MRALIFKIFLITGATTMAVMASSYFFQAGNPFLDSKSVSSSSWYVILFKSHVGFGIVSILIGPFQFFKKLRDRRKGLHRLLGKIYVGAIFLSATTGLVIAQYAVGGLITRIGFSTLAVIWFYFTYLAYTTIRKGNVKAHEIWMFRSYALTFSSLTLRLILLVGVLTSWGFIPSYQFASWGCWIINLIVCEWILNKPAYRAKLARS